MATKEIRWLWMLLGIQFWWEFTVCIQGAQEANRQCMSTYFITETGLKKKQEFEDVTHILFACFILLLLNLRLFKN
jgi:hypothetical protein